MDLILASKKADKTIMEVEGVGGYYGWSSSQFPLLSQKKLAAGLFLLQPRAFVQPYYSVSSKIAYVCQGTYDIYMFLNNRFPLIVAVNVTSLYNSHR